MLSAFVVALVLVAICAYGWRFNDKRAASAEEALASARAWSKTQAFNLNLLWATLQAERDKRAPVPPPIPDGPADVVWHRRTQGCYLPRYELDTDET
jgi:hypothetical protein